MSDALAMVREFFRHNPVAVFGTAPAASLGDQPEGRRPGDLLPGARGLVAFGLPVARGVYLGGARALRSYWRQACLFYRQLDLLASRLAVALEGPGQSAVPVPACFPFDLNGPGDFTGFVDLMAMGRAAGLGCRAKNGLLMHREYGPRLHLGGVVTSLELPCFNRGGGAWPCPPGCRACQEACPAGALAGEGRVDRLACLKASSYSPLVDHFMKEGRASKAQAESLLHLTGVDDHQMYTCMACITNCPRL